MFSHAQALLRVQLPSLANAEVAYPKMIGSEKGAADEISAARSSPGFAPPMRGWRPP